MLICFYREKENILGSWIILIDLWELSFKLPGVTLFLMPTSWNRAVYSKSNKTVRDTYLYDNLNKKFIY